MPRSSDSTPVTATNGSLPPNWIWQIRHVIPSVPHESRRVLDELLAQLREQSWVEHDVFSVHLAMEEALMNAIKHGNKLDARKCIHVVCKLSPQMLRIEVTDEGSGFDPAAVPDCTEDDRLEVPSGRGLMLMKSFMTDVEYNERCNGVILEKARTPAA
ncbi:MAG: ATP-binding protein [Pirellulales bacterium]